MVQEGGGNVEVGGVSFSIGVDLAAFQRNLAQAEQAAKASAARIQSALGSIPASQQTQEVVTRQRRRVVPPSTADRIPTPPNPPPINLTQEIVVRQQLRLIGPSSNQLALPGRAIGVPTSGAAQLSPEASAQLNNFVRQRFGLGASITSAQPGFGGGGQLALPAAGQSGFGRGQITIPGASQDNQGLQQELDAINRRAAEVQGTYRQRAEARQRAIDAIRQVQAQLNQEVARSGEQLALPAGPSRSSRSSVPKPQLTESQQGIISDIQNALKQPNSGLSRQTADVALNILGQGIEPSDALDLMRQMGFNSQQLGPLQSLLTSSAHLPTQLTSAQLRAAQRQVGPFPVSASQQRAFQQSRFNGPFPAPASVLRQFQQQNQYGPFPYQNQGQLNAARQAFGYPQPPGGGGGGSTGGGGAPFGLDNTNTQARALAELIGGVGLRYGVAVAGAKALHDLVVATVDATVQLEGASRQVAVNFGAAQAQGFNAGSQQFLANPQTAGTQQQYLQAAGSLAPLAQQYNLTQDQVQKLVTAEGQLARLHGVDLPQASQILNAVLKGNVDAGQALDIQLTDQYGILKNVGLSWDELVQAQGPAEARATLLQSVLDETNRQLANNKDNSDQLADSLDILGKAWDRVASSAQAASRNIATPIVTGAANIVQGVENNPNSANVANTGGRALGGIAAGAGAVAAGIVGGPALLAAAPVAGIVIGLQKLQQAFEQGDLGGPLQQLANTLRTAGGAVETSTANFAQVLRNLPQTIENIPSQIAAAAAGVSTAIGNLVTAIQAKIPDIEKALADLAAKISGGVQSGAQSTGNAVNNFSDQVANQAQQIVQHPGDVASTVAKSIVDSIQQVPDQIQHLGQAADQTANQLADTAQKLADAQNKQAQLETSSRINQKNLQRDNGPGSDINLTPAPQAQKEIQQLNDQQRADQAKDQQRRAANVASEAQARIDILNAQASNRQLDVAGQLNEYAKQRIDLQNQLAPLLLQQQAVQDQLNLASQQNLEITKQDLQARQAAIQPNLAVAGFQYQGNVLNAQADVAIRQMINGQQPSFSLNDIVKQQIGLGLGVAPAQANLTAIQANWQVQVADAAQSAEQIRAAIAGIPYQEELQVLQREVDVRQEELAAAQASSDAINRALEFANLLAAPDRIQAERDLNNSMIAAAQAAQVLANQVLAQPNAGLANDIIINVNFANPSVDTSQADMLTQLGQTIQTATIAALAQAASNAPSRVQQNQPGGR